MTILGIFLLNQIRTGGDRRYLELMELLAERKNNVFVIMNAFLDYTPHFFNKIEISVKYVRHHLPPASWLFKKHINNNLNKIKTEIINKGFSSMDIIHIHGDINIKSSLLLKKKLKCPLFYASRCNDIDRAKILRLYGKLTPKEYIFSLLNIPINKFREGQIGHYADLVTFQNSKDRDCFLARTKCDKSRTIIIPGNIGLPRCTPEWEHKNISSKMEKIVYIGSISAGKGFWDLLKTLADLKKKGFGFLRCFALGRKENVAQTLQLIKQLNVEDMVCIEGFKDPFPYLAECDLMVYPTLYDAFPDTVLEALHTDCPVIASSVGGLSDMLQYPELLFESGNIPEITTIIERCITNNSFYLHIRKLCAERKSVYHFDWAGKFENTMKEYLKQKGNKASKQ
ncbi:glycosyltransferase family 4 protein [Leadbettera azotonutricia]|uniref:Glycosyltransferase, group 1 family n=1 Tax=Leadbettera azotonutricia (strain ATCC BAA-888 / DSM 13862 / ZAS-9) TaxID=545695 RepID=F5YAU7_LEAAZ|nr:glycosyltransferase [Leadbettera azotonutricia]AEF82999.1 glycosyltransferase, group 1 family [Leadbettera azotonutricia ZAS-9]